MEVMLLLYVIIFLYIIWVVLLWIDYKPHIVISDTGDHHYRIDLYYWSYVEHSTKHAKERLCITLFTI